LLDFKMYIYNSTLEELMASIPREPSDKLISRLIDVINKYITIDKPNIGREVRRFEFLLKDYDFYDVDKHLTEDTLLKAIKLIKKMQFWTTDFKDLPELIRIHYCDFRFKDSPRLGEIERAIAELEMLRENYLAQGGKTITPKAQPKIEAKAPSIGSKYPNITDKEQLKFLKEMEDTFGNLDD